MRFWKYAALLLAALAASCGGGSQPEQVAAQAAKAMRSAAQQAAGPTMAWPDFRHMRAVHMMGNWGGNQLGFRPSLVASAPAIAASKVTINASTFAEGATTMDFADVVLETVRLDGGSPRARAGFWMLHNRATGELTLQFRPSLNTSLSGWGFPGDVNIAYKPGGTPYLDEAAALVGDARSLVMAVLAHAPELLATATAKTTNGSAMTGAFAASLLTPLRDLLATSDDEYFEYLKSINVEWIGISVGLHYDSYANPDVIARNCASGWFTDSNGSVIPCAFHDDHLAAFMAKARARGLKVYLTLAFESSADIDASSSCGTPQYKMSRWWLGRPELPQDMHVATCIAAGDWWWNPAHPQHAAKVARFWQTYREAAVRYATLAQAGGVELFSLGTETDFLFRTRPATGPFTNHFRTELQAMVDAVRGVYGGPVTYDMNITVYTNPNGYYGGAGSHHLFDDLGLDVVGLSAYFPLAATAPDRVLSVAELEAAWEAVYTNHLQAIRTRYPSKPILFTEVGYTDHVNAVIPEVMSATAGQSKPAGVVTDGMLQQRNIYEALFNVNARHGDLVAGFFLWGNDYFPLRPSGCTTIDWSFNCNPARDAVATGYRDWARRDADRVFAWAQAQFPQFFPGAPIGGTYQDYYYRYYPQTGVFVALHEGEAAIYVHNGANWNLLRVGTLREFTDLAGTAGY